MIRSQQQTRSSGVVVGALVSNLAGSRVVPGSALKDKLEIGASLRPELRLPFPLVVVSSFELAQLPEAIVQRAYQDRQSRDVILQNL